MYLKALGENGVYSGSMRNIKENSALSYASSDHASLILVFNGIFKIKKRGESITLTPGEYLIQKNLREIACTEAQDNHGTGEFFLITFDGIFSETEFLPLKGHFTRSSIMNQLIRLTDNKSLMYSSPFIKNSIFLEILGNLFQNVTKDSHSIAEKLSENILNNYKNPNFSFKETSLALSYSEDYLIRIFKKQFGITPHQYLSNLRIAESKKLMTSTTLSINHVALACGFKDYSVFYKSFLKNEHVPPKEWQKLNVAPIKKA